MKPCTLSVARSSSPTSRAGCTGLGRATWLSFRAGSHSVWLVTKEVRKLAVCRQSVPRPLVFVLRAWNKAFYRLTGFPTGNGLGDGARVDAGGAEVAAA